MHNFFIAAVLTLTLGFCSAETRSGETKVPDRIINLEGQTLTPYGFEDANGREITKAQYESLNDPKATIIWQDKDGRTTRAGG